MAANDEGERPIIVKKKKKVANHAHHGGAWKVAYADFVTAMMAFFLLLWLLSATTEKQREGIADYFSPTVVSESNSGGGGMLAGRTIAKEGALMSERAPLGVTMRLPQNRPVESPNRRDPDVAELEEALAERERARFDAAKRALEDALAARPALRELGDNLLVDRTDEGLRIQIVDGDGRAMFETGSPAPKPRTQELLTLVADSIDDLPNDVAIEGHTDSLPYRGDGNYTNWELSADRANASRRALLDAGLAPARVKEVVGRADQDLLLPDSPEAPRNRRISILLIQQDFASEAERRAARGETADGLQTGPSILEELPDGNAG
jgi:chemotaxis protein MotB